MNVDITCTLRWGVASVRITLLGMAHPIWEKHFRCGTCTDDQFSSGAARVKKGDVLAFIITFVIVFFKFL